MSKLTLALLGSALALVLPFTAGAHGGHGGHGAALEHFGWLRDLAGACWTGEHPDGQTRDTQCFETQFDRYIRGTIRLSGLRAGRWQPGLEGDSVFAWNPATQRISYWYWSNNGAFGPAEAYLEQDAIHFPAPRRDGSATPATRSVWKRLDADSYSVSRQQQDGAGWKEQFVVVYRRSPQAAIRDLRRDRNGLERDRGMERGRGPAPILYTARQATS